MSEFSVPPNQLIKMEDKPLTEDSQICFPSNMIPGFRHTLAVERGTNKNILIITAGGLGDIICAEPTIRYALEHFKGCKISVGTNFPEVFRHLNLVNIFHLPNDKVKMSDYYVFQTLYANHFQHDFIVPILSHCVDYASISAFRFQMPIKHKRVVLVPSQSDMDAVMELPENAVVIHAGRHWPTNTFPKEWWDNVLKNIIKEGGQPVLIGKDVVNIRGTVNVSTDGCIDLRNKYSIMQTVALLQKAQVFLCNDSSPLHMAATGSAWIGFLAAAKHPDLITHYRMGGFGWRMENLSLGGAWEVHDYCPNKDYEVRADNLSEYHNKWLPDPKTVAQWAMSKVK